jgi:hypothetical protein
MEINYRKLMEEWEIGLDSPVLDGAFVTKAQDFEAKLKAGSLTDDEIKAIDEELVTLFNQHERHLEDSPEVKKEKRKNAILEAREKIANAETIGAIEALEEEYGEYLPELVQFIEKRKEKIAKALEVDATKLFIENAGIEIEGAAYGALPALLEKYKDHPELIKVINVRVEKEKPEPKELTLKEKILNAKKRQWTYDELKALGIKITGDDMEIEGIYFQRQYLYKVYHIIKVDGKKV